MLSAYEQAVDFTESIAVMVDESLTTALHAANQCWNMSNVSASLFAARENRIYKLSSAQGVFALRQHRVGYRSERQIQSELLWMEMLANNGLSVPKPVPSFDGRLIQVVDGVVVDVLSWLEGTPLSKRGIDAQSYYDLGVVLATMHTLADNWQTPSTFARPTWDLVGDNPSWDRFWDNPELNTKQRVNLIRFRDRARGDVAKLLKPDFGLIHADLVPDNVLRHDTELQLIDFDDGGYGFRLFDIATVSLKAYRSVDSSALIDALLSGYQSQRAVDHSGLRLFEAIRACTYVGWNISRAHEAGGADRNIRFIHEAESAIDRYLCQG